MNYDDLMGEFRCAFCEAWGDTMNWWFAAVEELHHNRGYPIPDVFKYRPSPMGNTNDNDDLSTACVMAADTDSLARFARVLYRYARVLRRAGLSY